MIRRKLIGSQLIIDQTRNHSFNLDTVLLAKFLKIPKKMETILDVGTGNGGLLLYASELTYAKLIGVEIQEERYNLAVHNMKINGLEDRSEIILGDYLESEFKNLDCVISNPPFFKTENSDQLSETKSDQLARHEISLSLEGLVKTASKHLKYGGYFYMIHRANRFAEIVQILNQYHLTLKRVKFVHPYIDKPANHVLIQCIKQGKESLILDSPLIIYKNKHEFSDTFIQFVGEAI
ncbi:MAG: methyltransferase [Acholeplasmataceae bacterium]